MITSTVENIFHFSVFDQKSKNPKNNEGFPIGKNAIYLVKFSSFLAIFSSKSKKVQEKQKMLEIAYRIRTARNA
jgi:hypothetical protein